MVDYLDFSPKIHRLKNVLMRRMKIQPKSFLVFQYRSGDFGDADKKGRNEKRKLLLCNMAIS